MSEVQLSNFGIKHIELEKFSFKQTGRLERNKKGLSIEQSIGAVAKKQPKEKKENILFK